MKNLFFSHSPRVLAFLLIVLGSLTQLSSVFAQTPAPAAPPQNSGELKTAIFAGGCFWCMQYAFDRVPGVKKTVVGYTGGWLDAAFRRIMDVFVTIPFLVLVIAIVAVLGPGLRNMYIAVSLVGWVFYARLMRAEVLSQTRRDYPSASRVLGYTWTRIVFRHLVPNAITPVLIYLMTDMALCILLGSSLGYLGLGAQPPTAEWGSMLADSREFIRSDPWIVSLPGLAILITVVAINLLGDGLRDAFDPKMRRG